MGAVYRAVHRRLDRRVAVKVPRSQCEAEPTLLELFRGEARALAKVDHPNVVRVLDFDEDEAGPFLVLEYLEGETGAQRLGRTGRLPLSKVVAIISQVASALSEVHARGLVHCDLKPANIFLARCRGSEVVKLLDFGISVDTRAAGAEPRVPVGTPSYMAPEQALAGHALDHRADQFSLAAVVYELLAGQKAFGRDTPRTIGALSRAALQPVSDVAPQVPGAVDTVLRKATSLLPEDRYENILAFASALAAAARSTDRTGPLRPTVN